VAPLEPWEKVMINSEAFMATMHGQIACEQCHGGQQAPDKETAHTDLIAYPSSDPSTCGLCHAEIAKSYPDSLHSTQQGYWTVMEERGASHEDPAMQEMFGNHCASCHTNCGDCHVSQPRSVGGGFIDGHLFKAVPSITRNCTACHGSRVGNEYLGKHEDIKADVHFRQGRMKCTDCHSGDDLHGLNDETPANHRYEGMQMPSCKDCHDAVGAPGDEIVMHTMHGEKLSCQVCHSESYTSCDGCHVQVNEESGNPFFSTEGDYLTFFIGRNPLQNEERPYNYVPVRHIPVAPTSFGYYGENLDTFEALPTWAYSTPHNIQRNTPQNESCEACHGNPEIFLTADKVLESEMAANQNVIVAALPLMSVSDSTEDGESGSATLPASHAGVNFCISCHTVIPEPVFPASHASYTDKDCFNCHQPPEVVSE